ncbi:hypothetical protein N9P56_00950 [Flavobacteriaceae bacterium]|nr:hypothetical protein [Flavobacteriaceae bacterium]
MRYFIVTCHGWSASNWTAHALNLNENIICTHSARNELAEDKELQSNKNLKKHINDLQKGYLSRQSRSLDEIYEEIESKGIAKCYGSVHVLRMRDLPIIFKNHGISQRNFNLVNIVRHPIDLVWSGYGQFKDLFKYDINELYWTTGKVVRQALEFSNYIGIKYDLNMGELDNLAFIGACAILESLRFDIDSYSQIENIDNLNYLGTFKMEEITSNEEKYSLFFKRLGLIEYQDNHYIEKVFKTGIVNKHKHDSKKLTPQERYNQFLPWQKEVFNHFFSLHSLKEFYQKIGYNIEFID